MAGTCRRPASGSRTENYKMRFSFSLLLLACLIPAALHAYTPVESFAGLPDYRQPQLSPSGAKLAALVKVVTPDGVGWAIEVIDFDELTVEKVAYAGVDDFRINWIRWANDTHILVSARFPAVRYGTPTTETRLLSVNVADGKIRGVFSQSFLRQQDRLPQFQDQIVDLLPDDDEHILVSGAFQTTAQNDVYRLSLENRKAKRVLAGPNKVDHWITDRSGEIRIGTYQDEVEFRVMHRKPGGNTWDVLWKYEAFSEDRVIPLGFDSDPQILYINAYHDGREAIFKVDLRDPELRRELVFSDPNYDADGTLIYSRKAQSVVGVSFSVQGGFTFWDPEYQALQNGLDKALPDTVNVLYSLSDDERRYVILATDDTVPGSYYVGDRDAGTLQHIADRYSSLGSVALAPKKFVEYEARDGLRIEAYLTAPEGEGPHPTIIFPHGGPISFDDGGFDYWTQFFVSRGYAVLQMNFRGSAGQGYEFMKAGLQSWGLEMQNDVEDGARWMVENSLADPERICIVGASYGGYAALMEAARNPDLYRCAVSFAGVTDLAYLIRTSRRYLNSDVVEEQIGSDRKDLKARSPITLAEDVGVPVLLAHGTKDRRVDVRHGRSMDRALRKADKNVEYLEFDGGDHFLSNQDHRIAFFTAMDDFLQTHLER